MKRTSAGLFLLCYLFISACSGNEKILSVEADFALIVSVFLFFASLLLSIALVRVRKKLRRRIKRQSEELRDARQLALLHEKHLSIVVEDTGIGMDERQLHMLMNASPGNRVSIARTFGIGYTVIHTLLERMKGKLSIVSTPGKGTRVTVRIPVQVSSIW